MKPIPQPELDALRDRATAANPQRVKEYRALWVEIWELERPKLLVRNTPSRVYSALEDTRAVILGLLLGETPVETARMIALPHLKGTLE